MKGLFIPDITAEMFRNGCLESIESLMAEGEIYDIEYSRWIPVSERLPEDKTYVLTTIKVPNRVPHARSGWYEGGFFHNDNGDTWKATDIEVKAWMPLPKPYEPQESDDEWDRVTMIDVDGNTHKVTFKNEIVDIGDYPDEIPNQFDNLTGSMNV